MKLTVYSESHSATFSSSAAQEKSYWNFFQSAVEIEDIAKVGERQLDVEGVRDRIEGFLHR